MKNKSRNYRKTYAQYDKQYKRYLNLLGITGTTKDEKGHLKLTEEGENQLEEFNNTHYNKVLSKVNFAQSVDEQQYNKAHDSVLNVANDTKYSMSRETRRKAIENAILESDLKGKKLAEFKRNIRKEYTYELNYQGYIAKRYKMEKDDESRDIFKDIEARREELKKAGMSYEQIKRQIAIEFFGSPE